MGKALGRIGRWIASSSANLFALWTMLMSGILSLSREVSFAYMASIGRPVSPTGALQVFGHLSIAAFIFSAGFLLWRELQRVTALQERLVRPGKNMFKQSLIESIGNTSYKPVFLFETRLRRPVDQWKANLLNWTNETYDFLNTTSIQAAAKFRDVLGLVGMSYSNVHSDLEADYNVFNRRLGNLTQILEKKIEFFS